MGFVARKKVAIWEHPLGCRQSYLWLWYNKTIFSSFTTLNSSPTFTDNHKWFSTTCRNDKKIISFGVEEAYKTKMKYERSLKTEDDRKRGLENSRSDLNSLNFTLKHKTTPGLIPWMPLPICIRQKQTNTKTSLRCLPMGFLSTLGIMDLKYLLLHLLKSVADIRPCVMRLL